MKLSDIVNGPWAITPDMLSEIQSIYRTHLRGEKIDISKVEARLGRELKNENKGYQVIDNVAVLDIDGAIAKKMNLFTEISGGVSSELVKRDLSAALNDPTITGVILAIDSPGGTVDGTAELTQTIRAARGQKPIIAWTDGMMASAAYWIGSAADEVYISSGTTMVGSIGVVASHIDMSKAEEKCGVKTTEITAGKYKRISSQFEPLSSEGREDIQSKIDVIYSVFVEDVATNRGVAVEEVLTRMADGRVFVGRQAIDAGLVDGVATLEELIAKINQNQGSAGAVLSAKKGAKIMNIEQLKAEHPDLVTALVAEATTGMISATEVQAQLDAAAASERDRIKGVEDQLIPGHEALINSLKFDGKTTADQAASAVLAAEKGARAAALAAIDQGANEPAGAVEPPVADSGVDPNLPLDERCKAQWDKDAALRAEFGGNLAAFIAYSKKAESGSARIFGKK